jgi:hypothetical protein
MDRLFPFQARNMVWMKVLFKMYACCMILNLILAGILYGIGGTQGPSRAENEDPNMHFDECMWFVFTTFHSVAFGECLLKSDAARVIGCLISFYGYFFQVLSFAVILLSQLGGARQPTFLSVPVRMCAILWPSFLLFVAIIVALGLGSTPFINPGMGMQASPKDGVYFGWCVAFGNTYGDYYPVNNEGRAISGVLDLISWIYKCYALALLALRRPTREEHETLLGYAVSGKDEVEGLAAVFGPGYIAPSTLAPRTRQSVDVVELA